MRIVSSSATKVVPSRLPSVRNAIHAQLPSEMRESVHAGSMANGKHMVAAEPNNLTPTEQYGRQLV